MKLTIVYWNTDTRNGLASIALHDRREADVIAIQEPWFNQQTKTVYCPAQSKYRRIYSGEGRAVLYIHKRHPPLTWEADTGLDWCRIVLYGVTIWSIYSPIPSTQSPWTSPLQRLASEDPAGPQVIVGDLNLHHPLWDKVGRLTPESSVLLQLACRWTLTLRTPWGEPTRRRYNDQD